MKILRVVLVTLLTAGLIEACDCDGTKQDPCNCVPVVEIIRPGAAVLTEFHDSYPEEDGIQYPVAVRTVCVPDGTELTFTNDDDLRVFVKAIKLVRQRVNPEMSPGEAAALIATNYLGVAARDDEGGIPVELDSLIRCIEQGYRVRLKVSEYGIPIVAVPKEQRIVPDVMTIGTVLILNLNP